MDYNINILTTGSDPAETLQVKLTKVCTEESTTSIKELRDRLVGYDAQIQAIQDQKAKDQALLDSITSVFTSAGVTDLSQPLTDEITAAIGTQNDAANAAVVEAQKGKLNAL